MSRSIRVLMVAPQPFFRPRGTPFSVLHRIRALLRLGHQVDLVTYPFGDDPGLDGLRIHRSARPPLIRDVRIGPSAAKLALDVPLFRVASNLARSGAFDLLHTHEEAAFVGPWIAGRTGMAHLYDMHSSLPQQFGNFGRYQWGPVVSAFQRLERHAVFGSDGVITVYPALRDHVRSLGYDGPVAVIENTLDLPHDPVTPDEVKRLREELGLTGAPVVLYTGTLEAYQGLDILVEAAAVLEPRRPDVRLLSVGGTPAQIAGLRDQARGLGVEGMFVFVPTVPPEEVFAYLELADALVTCRVRGTNTPLKIYQYLRSRRPVIATAIESHLQVLDESVAELVEPTSEGVARGIERVLDDEVAARQMAGRAHDLASDRYGEERYMEGLSTLLDQVLPGVGALEING
jgi:glycosyltransferase involved in cell wall biosynthesis